MVQDPHWEQYGTPKKSSRTITADIRQPFFKTKRSATTLTIKDGSTVLVGGGGKSHYKSKSDETVYTFVTARLIGPDGNALKRE